MSAKIVPHNLNLTSSAIYQIRVQGELDARWAVWFEEMAITAVANETIFTGTVADQAALHSLLAKIRDLGLPLIAVNHIESDPETAVKVKP